MTNDKGWLDTFMPHVMGTIPPTNQVIVKSLLTVAYARGMEKVIEEVREILETLKSSERGTIEFRGWLAESYSEKELANSVLEEINSRLNDLTKK